MATVHDMLKCPKCNNKMMGMAIPQTFGKEYFAHCCHEYFGVNELVNQWGYDAADLFHKIDSVPRSDPTWKKWYSEFDGGEPYWNNLAEYQDAQAMITRMLVGIPEIDDYADLISTYEDALGVGVQ